MAVTATVTRFAHEESSVTREFCNLNLTGTYATGGFTINPFQVVGSTLGASPLTGSNVLFAQFAAPSGYTYVATTGNSTTMTIKILNGITELANGTAVPDAVVPMVLTKSRR